MVMAEVVDQMLKFEQLLLRELQTRFPEVPLDVVYTIMQKTSYNRERSIEALARECQKYQLTSSVPSYLEAGDKWDRDYCHQHSDSNESRGSASSNNSGLGGSMMMSPAIAMKSSNSFPYIPAPNPVDYSTRPLHDPAPRSSLPLSSDIHGRAPGYGNRTESPSLPGGYFDAGRRLELHSIVSSASSGSVLLSPDKHYSQPRSLYGNQSPNSHVFRPPNVTSEVTYMIGGSGDSSATRSQSVWVQQPMYLSETRLNIQPPMHDLSQPTTSGDSLGTSADPRSPNSYSALFMHPMQAWVKNQSVRPATYVSSHSSSSENLSSQPSVMNSDESKMAVRWQRLPYPNGPPLGHSTSSDDASYLAALQICQKGNLDKLRHHFQETLRYRHTLCLEIDQMQSQLITRLQNRSVTFPTADDLHKLQSENRQLQFEIQQLTRQIDLAGDVPLGITDPVEAQSFIRSNSMRRSASRLSAATSSLSIGSPTPSDHRELPLSPSHHHEQQIFDDRRLEDEEEGRWACGACTFLNHPALKNCECCEMPRLPCHR